MEYISVEAKKVITVQNPEPALAARKSSGIVVNVFPTILITATFDGFWESKADMDRDFESCVKRLREAYAQYLSGRND